MSDTPIDNTLYNMGYQLKQGKDYRRKKETTPLNIIENFSVSNSSSDMSVSGGYGRQQQNPNKYMLNKTIENRVANSDDKEITDLVHEFNHAKTIFDLAYNKFSKKTKHFINAETTAGNPYLGKNITINDVGLSYVTEKGFYKPYGSPEKFAKIAGNNGCPEFVSDTSVSLADTPLTQGTYMIDGQACGSEGKNIYINQTAVPQNLVYNNCYKATDDSGAEETELGVNVEVSDCAQRAADNNKNIFSLQKGSLGDDQCFIWDDLPSSGSQHSGVENLASWNDDDSTTPSGTPLLVMMKNGMFQIWFVGTSIVKKARLVSKLSAETDKVGNGYLDNWRAAYIDLMTELTKITPVFSWLNFLEIISTDDIWNDIIQWDEWFLKVTKLNFWDCDGTYGGGINSLTSTWGANCGETSGNYTDNLSSYADGRGKISTSIGKIKTWKKTSRPKVSHNIWHPSKIIKSLAKLAEWEAECETGNSHNSLCGSWKYSMPCSDTAKNFSINYKCGGDQNSYQKTSDGNGAEVGDAISLDCQKTSDMCGNFGLSITDTGSIQIVNNKVAAQPYFLFKQTEEDWETKARTNGQWEQNTLGSALLAGQILLGGEFLTDSNNKFQLILQSTGVLELNMAVHACIPLADDSSYYHPDSTLTNPLTSAYYTFDLPKNDNLNKAGYITDNGEIKEYPSSMITTAGKTFTKSPAYMQGGHWRGWSKKAESATSPDDLAKKCIALGDRCIGYTYSEDTNNKKLYSEMYPKSGTRIPTAGTDMYLRNVEVKNHNSCNKEVVGGPSNVWETYKQISNMTKSTKCDLAKNTAEEGEALRKARHVLDNIIQKINKKLASLQDTGITLDKEMRKQVSAMRNNIKDYTTIRANLGNVADKLTNIVALEKDTDLTLVSNNYKYVLWSILAIIFVIAGIKISRKK